MASERLRGLGEVPGCSEPQLLHLQCEDHDPGRARGRLRSRQVHLRRRGSGQVRLRGHAGGPGPLCATLLGTAG